MQNTIRDFVQSYTALLPVPFVPELFILQASDMMRVWNELRIQSGEADIDVPYWAFVWPGGQALARHVLDNRDIVKDKRVLDLACGSGVVALAAAKAGAASVFACDIDPMARMATSMNAALNQIDIDVGGEMDLSKLPKDIDLILAGDICYEQVMSHRLLRWLMICREAGIRVVVADPKRGYAPDRNPNVRASELAVYTVPTSRELEDNDTRDVILWELESYSTAS